jgi:transmembrane sensor
MTRSIETDRERAGDEAAAWLVLMSEQPDDIDLRGRFNAWKAASEFNAEIWARTCRAYDLVGKGTPAYRAYWAPLAERRKLAETRKIVPISSAVRWSFRGRRLCTYIAAGAMAAGLAIAFLPGLLTRIEADAITGTGEVRTVTLEDGSKVGLAPESAIAVAFANKTRHVRLLKGEAFFEVTHDPSRPFSVVAGDAVATVLGTAFDVRRDDEGDGEGTVVAVQRGHVKVSDDHVIPPVSEDLLAGQWVRVGDRGDAIRGTTEPDDIADWRGGRLIARDRAIGEIVATLRHYYSGVILVRDDIFALKHVSGVYDLQHPVETLRELAASHGASVQQISPWLVIVRAGESQPS